MDGFRTGEAINPDLRVQFSLQLRFGRGKDTNYDRQNSIVLRLNYI